MKGEKSQEKKVGNQLFDYLEFLNKMTTSPSHTSKSLKFLLISNEKSAVPAGN